MLVPIILSVEQCCPSMLMWEGILMINTHYVAFQDLCTKAIWILLTHNNIGDPQNKWTMSMPSNCNVERCYQDPYWSPYQITRRFATSSSSLLATKTTEDPLMNHVNPKHFECGEALCVLSKLVLGGATVGAWAFRVAHLVQPHSPPLLQRCVVP